MQIKAEQGIGVKSYIRYDERFRRDNEEMRQRRRIGDGVRIDDQPPAHIDCAALASRADASR